MLLGGANASGMDAYSRRDLELGLVVGMIPSQHVD